MREGGGSEWVTNRSLFNVLTGQLKMKFKEIKCIFITILASLFFVEINAGCTNSSHHHVRHWYGAEPYHPFPPYVFGCYLPYFYTNISTICREYLSHLDQLPDFTEYTPPEGKIRLQSPFNISAFTGTWYEIYRTNNLHTASPNGSTENGISFAINTDDSLTLVNRAWLPMVGRWLTETALARVVETGRIAIQFLPYIPPADFRVLSTDYITVAAVYADTEFLGFDQKYAWIFSRTTNLADEVVNQTFSIFRDKTNLTSKDFIKSRHNVAPRNIQKNPPTATPMVITESTTKEQPVTGKASPSILPALK